MNTNEIIKRKRKEKGMTQTDLGKLLGVSKATVQKYESGEIVNFKSDTIKKLSEILDIDPSVLVFGKYEAKLNGEKLKNEVILLDTIKCFYGKETIDLLEIFTKLNPEQQEKVIDYADLVENSTRWYNKVQD